MSEEKKNTGSRRLRRGNFEVRLWENYLARRRYAGDNTPAADLKRKWRVCREEFTRIPCVCEPSLPEFCICQAPDTKKKGAKDANGNLWHNPLMIEEHVCGLGCATERGCTLYHELANDYFQRIGLQAVYDRGGL